MVWVDCAVPDGGEDGLDGVMVVVDWALVEGDGEHG